MLVISAMGSDCTNRSGISTTPATIANSIKIAIEIVQGLRVFPDERMLCSNILASCLLDASAPNSMR
jgi:hypothetical protein